MRELSFVLVLCACGNSPSRATDAGTDVGTDGSSDTAPTDAVVDTPTPSGFTIGGTAVGVRGSTVLTLVAGTDAQHVILNADGPFRFPGTVAAGTSYSVTTSNACAVVDGSGTGVAADVTNVQALCSGVVELASVSFASGATPFTSMLSPSFDPGATAYTGTRPYFMDDTDLLSVTPVAVYPALSSISVYGQATVSGQASAPHVLGAVVPVRLQAPPTLDRTYQFVLQPATPVQTGLYREMTPTASATFGTSVARAGDVVVAGAPDRGPSGAVTVFRRAGTTWAAEQILQPTTDVGARAGYAVAVDNDVVVVGAPIDALDDSGRAYVYRYSAATATWALEATLAAASPLAAAHCGLSVAVSGSYIAMGCPGEKGSGNKQNAGALYFFRYDAATSTWVADGTFKGANANDELGGAAALSGTTAVVGARMEANGTALAAGGVHVLVRTGAATWTQEGTTLRGDVTANAHFGAAVSISGDYVIVGQPDAVPGSAFVFHRVSATWSIDGSALVPSTLATDGASFGASVAIDGTHAAIGSPLEDAPGQDTGAVHVYRRELSGWSAGGIVTATAQSTSRFGQSVALDGEWLAVGAPNESSVLSYAGAIYTFR